LRLPDRSLAKLVAVSVRSTAYQRRDFELLLVSFIALFLELAIIRWLSTEIRIFAYFKNLPLMAAFLGFGIGCYLHRSADTLFYKTFPRLIGILASIGPVPLAVTINLSINFLRKPAACDLIAECRLLKLGKRLATGEVSIFSDGMAEPVAHVTSTYSIPGKT